MAKVTVGSSSAEVKDGDSIQKVAEGLGIPFSCKDGVCGSCMCNVLSGKENLSPVNQKEKDYGLDENGKKRLACQCKIKSGEVKIESGY